MPVGAPRLLTRVDTERLLQQAEVDWRTTAHVHTDQEKRVGVSPAFNFNGGMIGYGAMTTESSAHMCGY